jgi:glycosyltransferase involved in cell wall biosynthesis
MSLFAANVVPGKLKNIVFVWFDMARIGGVSGRIRRTIVASQDRHVNYFSFSITGDLRSEDNRNLILSSPRANALLATFSPDNTVLVLHNTVADALSRRGIDLVDRFPAIHFFAGQLSWFLQDSKFSGDVKFIKKYRANKLVTFSFADKLALEQFGIYDVEVLPPAIPTVPKNVFRANRNLDVGYVGRIDFHAKGSDRLVSIARSMKAANLGALKIFTTTGSNSPDLNRLKELFAAEDAENCVEFIFDRTEKAEIYASLRMLLVPSRKEAFGNAILEAMSFGVPVIAAKYCPGPNEIIQHGSSGLLLDRFDAVTVVDAIRLVNRSISTMSRRAFERHKDFPMQLYLPRLESLSERAIANFRDRVSFQVYPDLAVHKFIEIVSSSLGYNGNSHGGSPEADTVVKQIALERKIGSLIIKSWLKPTKMFKLPLKIFRAVRAHRIQRSASNN